MAGGALCGLAGAYVSTIVVESLLVLDASQGQNGLREAMAFAKAAGLTGVVLTKLDGSARGGVALAVASEAGLPIRSTWATRISSWLKWL